MPLNSLFPRGNQSERWMMENLIIESIRMYGQEFYYIPRTVIAMDDVLGEDNLSKFKDAYMIECYIDNIDNWGGQGSFMSKFGLQIEEQATLTVARRRWDELVGQYGKTIIPDRPCEGDLMYFPLSDSMFEVKFVEHQSPFYQLGQLPVYKLKVELFQYSSERFETDLDEINRFALDMTFDVLGKPSEIADPEHRDNRQDQTFNSEATGVINFDETNPFGN